MAETHIVVVTVGAEAPDDSAWVVARARFGKLAPLLRIVDLGAGTDEFIALSARPEFGDLLLDGCCLIRPKPDKPA